VNILEQIDQKCHQEDLPSKKKQLRRIQVRRGFSLKGKY
jgi:hypothetical protein